MVSAEVLKLRGRVIESYSGSFALKRDNLSASGMLTRRFAPEEGFNYT
jgi:hypothetical protein